MGKLELADLGFAPDGEFAQWVHGIAARYRERQDAWNDDWRSMDCGSHFARVIRDQGRLEPGEVLAGLQVLIEAIRDFDRAKPVADHLRALGAPPDCWKFEVKQWSYCEEAANDEQHQYHREAKALRTDQANPIG